jgi:HEAT repeat protein
MDAIAVLLLLLAILGATEARPAAHLPATRESLARCTLTLAEGDSRARLAAVVEIGRLGGDEAGAILALAALSDDDPFVRAEALHGLGELGRAAELPSLEQALIDPDPEVREAAVQAIAALGGDEAARALGFALHDPETGLREEVVYALGEIGGDIAVDLLQVALSDDSEIVRSSASEVLAELAHR